MKYLGLLLQLAILGLPALAFSSNESSRTSERRPMANVIEGTVFDPGHRAVPDLWIELQNEFNLNLFRVRTGGTGRFYFSGMGTGRYYIKVYTSGTDFEEQTVAVEVVNVVANASDTVYQDVFLRLRKGKGNIGIKQATEAIFVQEVPADARRLYNQGVKDIAVKDESIVKKGQDELDQAIKIFPDYYDALNALGCYYVAVKDYAKSLPYLIHAIDVNQRTYSSFYSLGYAAYKLSQLPEATSASRAATILQPNSVNAQLLYGTVLRLTGNYDQSLEALLKAEKLSSDSPVAEVHWQLALVLNHLKRDAEAADHLEKYLRINPDAANRKQVEELIRKLRSAKSA